MVTRKQILLFATLLLLCCTIIFAQNRKQEAKRISPKELRTELSSYLSVKPLPKTTSFESRSDVKIMQSPQPQDSFSFNNKAKVHNLNKQSQLPPPVSRVKSPQLQNPNNNSGNSSLIPPPSCLTSLDQGNDACPPTIISRVPYVDTGTTVGKTDNFHPSCSPLFDHWPGRHLLFFSDS